MDYILTTEVLSKRFGHFNALNELSMHVPAGSIYGFVGKNGAGKTTFMRLICGICPPTSGTYTLFSISSQDKNIVKARRRMGAVVETPAVNLDMTAEDNLKLQYRILGLPCDEGIPDLLELVGLRNTGKKKARQFSFGMKQRLGIAVALAGNPDFLVLDEPINGLDPQGIVEIRELLLTLNRQHQITILISSHILGELSKLATHYGFIDNGRIVKEMSACELEDACKKCMHIEVSDVKILARILDAANMDYKILSGNTADIYAKPNLSELVTALAKEHCEVFSVQEQDESLESYYINLIGGAKNG